MNTLAVAPGAHIPARISALLRSPWLWCLAAALYFVTIGIGYGGGRLESVLGDTDDATRLLQLRRYLAGAGWYDLTIPQLGGSEPLVSHWSRLIDAALAILVKAASLFVAPDRAELFARAAWPVIVLVGLLRALAHETEQRAGTAAAALAVFLAVTAPTGLYQFSSGRIDHHNVMILATVAGLLCLARGLETPRLGTCAGIALGFALVIGYEPLALIVPVAAFVAVIAALNRAWLESVRNLALALTATLAAGLVVSQPPSSWLSPVCDAVGLNLVALAGAGAAGLALLVARGTTWSPLQRLATLAGAGAIGVAAYAALEPACLAGPYGAINADAKRIWLATVIETQPLWETLAMYPLLGLVFIVFAGAALRAAIARARNTPTTEARVTLAVLVIAIVSAILQMKFIPYATFLAVVVLAVSIANWRGSENISPRAALFLGAIAINQLLLSMLLLPLADRLERPESAGLAARNACSEVPVVRTLNALSPGLIVGHVNLGPYVAATTHHRALAAPYHRIGDAIAESWRILNAEPAEAETRLRNLNAAYVLHCFAPAAPGKAVELDRGVSRTSLQGRLTHGETLPFLEKLPLATSNMHIHIWRVLPAPR